MRQHVPGVDDSDDEIRANLIKMIEIGKTAESVSKVGEEEDPTPTASDLRKQWKNQIQQDPHESNPKSSAPSIDKLLYQVDSTIYDYQNDLISLETFMYEDWNDLENWLRQNDPKVFKFLESISLTQIDLTVG